MGQSAIAALEKKSHMNAVGLVRESGCDAKGERDLLRFNAEVFYRPVRWCNDKLKSRRTR
jgi:hypothetical protein